MLPWPSRQIMNLGEQLALLSNISTQGNKNNKEHKVWMVVIGKLWGSSVIAECLVSLLSSSVTVELSNEPVKGVLCLSDMADVIEQTEVSCQLEGMELTEDEAPCPLLNLPNFIWIKWYNLKYYFFKCFLLNYYY